MTLAQKFCLTKATPEVVFWLVGGLLFRGVIAFWLAPGFDEAYYYLYSRHLAWSYFDHPVLVALTTGFGPWLTGEISRFTIRLGALILHTGSLWLLYLTSVQLFSMQAGRLTLAIATLIPIFQIGFGTLTLPDSPLIFFWSASLYCAAGEFFPSASADVSPAYAYRPTYRLTLLSVLVGLACLGKYHGFVLGLGLVGFCLTSPRHRCALVSSWAWLGMGLFVITLFPLWFWNSQHDWVSFRFQLSARFVPNPGVEAVATPPNSALSKPAYNLLSTVGIFFAGIAYLFPSMGFPLWWVSMRSLINLSLKGRNSLKSGIKPDKLPSKSIWRLPLSTDVSRARDLTLKQLFILWISLPLTLGFTLLAGIQQVFPTWPMPGFWGLTLLLGQQATGWQQPGIARWLKGSGIAVGSLVLVLLLHVTLGILQKPGQYALMGGLLPPQQDPSTELLDIRQLRRGFSESSRLRRKLQAANFVFTNAYYLGGLIDMALRPLTSVPITCFSNDMRGFNFWWQSEQWLGQDALYITLERFHQMPAVTHEYQTYFSSLTELATIPIYRGGTLTEVFYVYEAKTLLKPYPASIQLGDRHHPR
ncbi:MAG: glycosyltransferase family 39 protein [Cyanothece sp. SIO1E1]|nr:glycosyltransferase family 39 protein [Cyanothece sp. SIO1E1]